MRSDRCCSFLLGALALLGTVMFGVQTGWADVTIRFNDATEVGSVTVAPVADPRVSPIQCATGEECTAALWAPTGATSYTLSFLNLTIGSGPWALNIAEPNATKRSDVLTVTGGVQNHYNGVSSPPTQYFSFDFNGDSDTL